MDNKKVAGVLSKYLDDVSSIAKRGGLLDALSDEGVYADRKVCGTQFPLGLLFQVLFFVRESGLVASELTDSTMSYIRHLMLDRFRRDGFSYLENSLLPPDLDTMAVTVGALHGETDCKKLARYWLANTWRDDGLPPVFLSTTESEARDYGQRFHCGTHLWHLDVLINVLIVEQIVPWFESGVDYSVVENMKPINYWFIPSTFTYFRLAQLRRLLNRPHVKTTLSSVDSVTSVPQMQIVFQNRRCVVLETALFSAANLDISADEAVRVSETISNDDPLLYPSIGFRPYRSSLLYRGLLSMAIAHAFSVYQGGQPSS